MKFAVVLAHPNPESFCASIARTCVEQLTGMGHLVDLRDLYAMDFDPRLKARELPTSGGYQADPDVEAERRRLSEVETFVFVYPFWFNAEPAILKGYVDRVFSLGFGYGPGFGCVEPLLFDRKLLSFSTSGAPDQWVNSSGALRALMSVFDLHLGAVCGLKVLDHIHFGGIVANMEADPAEEILEKVRQTLRTQFQQSRRTLRMNP